MDVIFVHGMSNLATALTQLAISIVFLVLAMVCIMWQQNILLDYFTRQQVAAAAPAGAAPEKV